MMDSMLDGENEPPHMFNGTVKFERYAKELTRKC